MRSFSKIAAYVILLTCQKAIQQHKIPPTAGDPNHLLPQQRVLWPGARRQEVPFYKNRSAEG